MSPNRPVELNVVFARRLAELIDAKLLTSRELIPWADAMILKLDRPPEWIIDLSVATYQGDALAAVRKFACSEPWDSLPADISSQLEDDHIAALYLRYERGELSWASFLRDSGEFADCTSGSRPCEYFYARLTALEDAEFSKDVERAQKADVVNQFAGAIERVRRVCWQVRSPVGEGDAR